MSFEQKTKENNVNMKIKQKFNASHNRKTHIKHLNYK